MSRTKGPAPEGLLQKVGSENLTGATGGGVWSGADLGAQAG
jgi:hypothetical protein